MTLRLGEGSSTRVMMFRDEPTMMAESRLTMERWIDDVLVTREITRVGPPQEIRSRLWGTVFRVPTTRGEVYLKVLASFARHEVSLAADLYRSHPRLVVPVIGADVARGWLLLADAGEPGDTSWEEILPRYATLQIDLLPRVEDFVAAGVPDRRPHKLLTLFDELLAAPDLLQAGRPHGLSIEQIETLRGLRPAVAAAARRLVAVGIPPSLDHGDLHAWNIAAGRIFDWGDAAVAHPFSSLRSVFWTLERDGMREKFAPLRDAYLLPWQRLASRGDLLEAFDLAQRLWPLEGVAVWYRILSPLAPAEVAPFARHIPRFLSVFLQGMGG